MNDSVRLPMTVFNLLSKKHQSLAEQIMPEWSKEMKCTAHATSLGWIDTTDDDLTSGISMNSMKFCMVGEAHGFSRKYSGGGSEPCDDCRAFSIRRLYNTIEINTRFAHTLEKFLDHYVEAHS